MHRRILHNSVGDLLFQALADMVDGSPGHKGFEDNLSQEHSENANCIVKSAELWIVIYSSLHRRGLPHAAPLQLDAYETPSDERDSQGMPTHLG